MRSTFALRIAAGGMLLLSRPVGAEPITLAEAVKRATVRPDVRGAQLGVDATRAIARHAGRRLHSPELSVAAGPRRTGSDTLVEAEVSLSQTFELGGKGSTRKAVAEAETQIAEHEVQRAMHVAKIETWRAYQLALLSRKQLQTAQEAETLAVQVDEATQDRQRLGAATQLEVNLTNAEVGRARHDRLEAERSYDRARAVLATAVGARADEQLEPVGDLDLPMELTEQGSALQAGALERRADLQISKSSLELARRQVDAASAAGKTDLTLGVSYVFEQDPLESAHLVMLQASIGLPFGVRNQGAREAARIQTARAELGVQQLTTEITREVAVAAASYRKTREAALAFDREVNERLSENLELARESFANGKIDYYEFSIVRRELIASRIAYLEAIAETIDARASLDLATAKEVSQ